MNILQIIVHQKQFFSTGKTKEVASRKEKLQLLLTEVQKREKEITNALFVDFKKPEYEAVMTETSYIVSELKLTLKKLHRWAKPKRVFPALLNFPSSSKIYNDPLGTVLIIAPWNYPYQLALAPLIGAVAAGNTVVLKPSELTPNTSKIIKEIIKIVFDENWVIVVEGGVEVSTELLAQRWNYIFFTGSVHVGKIVAKAAAKFLTPITLELGGKNPCIIDETANIQLAAKRIVWGKCINGGQTCIAPDYLLIHTSVKEKFVDAFKKEVENAYGKNVEESEDFSRIINQKNFERLTEMLVNENILFGGQTTAAKNYISPTLIDEPSLDSEVMKGEIFGPIFPVISYKNEDEINAIISRYEKPLAFYVFTNRTEFAQKMIRNYSFGGGTINDTTVHFVNNNLPFGGVGESGIGSYHGKKTFAIFTHKKGIVKRYNWLDISVRYPPYKGKLKTLKRFTKLF
ncbi:MAG: aldehyde dehydrogenase [Polaribacter sp.]